jgi:hypothetical protein
LQSRRICPSPQPVTTDWNWLQPEMKDLNYIHIYEPAIHLMSTYAYVAHAVAWLVQNGLPSLSWGHFGAVMLGEILYTMRAFRTPCQHSPYQVPTPNNMPQWPYSFTFTTPTDPNTVQAQQASHVTWNATMMHPCLLCHIISKTGMSDQTWAQMQDRGGGQRGTEGIGSVGGTGGSRIGDQMR